MTAEDLRTLYIAPAIHHIFYKHFDVVTLFSVVRHMLCVNQTFVRLIFSVLFISGLDCLLSMCGARHRCDLAIKPRLATSALRIMASSR